MWFSYFLEFADFINLFLFFLICYLREHLIQMQPNEQLSLYGFFNLIAFHPLPMVFN
jgi:hypothetical protein